jgi:hypothetical protein
VGSAAGRSRLLPVCRAGLVASLIGSIWLVARIFRAAMLMYGQALRPQQLLQALLEA